MLSHLLYISNRNSNCSENEIDSILDACQKNNKALDITGVLLYSDKKFVQYLEGEREQITSLYDKIKLDERHSGSIMMSYAPITERLFPSWSMGSKKIGTNEYEFDAQIGKKEKEEFNGLLTGKITSQSNALSLIKKFFN